MFFITINFTLKAQYCVTNLYSVGCVSGAQNYKIDSLQIGTINMPNTPCNNTSGTYGYSNLTGSLSTNLYKNHTYNLRFYINTPSSSNNYAYAWIDYNDDYNFDNSTEMILQSSAVSPGVYNQSITIPANASTGSHRMRIRISTYAPLSATSTACDYGNLGEAIDFTVNIAPYYDAGVDSILTPANIALVNSIVSPIVRVHNFGDSAINNSGYNVYYSVNNGTPTSTYLTLNLAPGASTNVTLTSFTVLSTLPSPFTICAWTSVPGDVYHANDTICKNVTINTTLTNDVGINTISTPSSSVISGTTITPYVYIKNYGNTSVTNVPVSYSVNGVLTGTGIYTGTIGTGGTGYYSFTTTFNAPNSNFTICAWTGLSTDSIHGDDTLCKTVISTPSTIDASLTSIGSPATSLYAGASVNVIVYFKNTGNTTLTNVPIKYSINHVLADTGTAMGTFYTSSTYSYTFPNQLTIPTSNFTFCVWTDVVGDNIHSNDTSCISVTVVATPNAHDVLVSSIVNPLNTVPVNSNQNVSVWIKNKGTATETSVPISYQVGSSTPVTETWTGILFNNDSTIYNFANTFTAPTSSTFNFCASTNLVNDQNTANDKLCKTVNTCTVPVASGAITCSTPGTNNGHNISFASTSSSPQTVTYKINKISGATSYSWTYSGTGATIPAGSDTSAAITFAATATGGNLSVKGINSCGNGNASNFTIGISVGINEYNMLNATNIYPNPAHDKLNIDCSSIKKGKTKFIIYNIEGAKLIEEEININSSNSIKVIDISHLNSGVYFIKIENESGTSNNKFVVE